MLAFHFNVTFDCVTRSYFRVGYCIEYVRNAERYFQ